jgi:hypothetical protein
MVSDWLSVVSSVSLALVECLLVLITFHIFPQQQMSKVLTAVEHLNQAKAEAATDSERCAINIETGAGTTNEAVANASTSGEISSIGSVSVWNANVDSGSMAFGSGETDFGDTRSITVAIGNAQQQAVSITMASSSIKTRVLMPRLSKRVWKGLCDQAMTNQDSSAALRSKDIDITAQREESWGKEMLKILD